jgi:hypothetical protein
LHDPHAAVYVALLLLDQNQTDSAREYVEAAERGPIYLEEKKLLDEAKTKLVSSSPSPAPSVTPTPASSPTAGSTSAPSPAATSPPLP